MDEMPVEQGGTAVAHCRSVSDEQQIISGRLW
jgi:hypothetical protein